jgi:hypothetical protein
MTPEVAAAISDVFAAFAQTGPPATPATVTLRVR